MISLRYYKLFSLNILSNSYTLPIPEELTDCFIFVAPSKGLNNSPVYDKGEAILYFHQSIMNSKDIIIYSPNKLGIYRMIYAVPMIKPPTISLVFEKQDLLAELTEVSKTNAKFKVKDKYGQTIKKESKVKRCGGGPRCKQAGHVPAAAKLTEFKQTHLLKSFFFFRCSLLFDIIANYVR